MNSAAHCPERERPKITIQNQIDYMRDRRGIKFNIVTEEQAAIFLASSNYFFKLKAFEKNYSTYPFNDTNQESGKAGKYCDLEFAYLQELSTLDMYFREIVLILSLDIEHFLRVRLMRDISNNENEDGYTIVSQFLNYQPHVAETIEHKKNNSYCEQLIDKYSPNFPIWALIEVLSFGDLINLCDLYYSKYPAKDIHIGDLRTVKFIRNAAAHNNCLLNNLTANCEKKFTQNRRVNSYLARKEICSQNVRAKNMRNRTVHDFIVLLFTFSELASPGVKKHQFQKVQDLIDNRFYDHMDFFSGNALISSTFEFLKKVVDKMASDCV